ncbi:ORF1218 [White spot syndrome virus]|uniref:ORF1218 n=1 Tax=White spot syndrome virus TaxID=342409 RepID=A0A2D3I6A6_9VIRU|nr:ORF1218 [White spot syndrome virus]
MPVFTNPFPPSSSSQKLFKNFSGSLQFRGWTAESIECQVRRVDRWVDPMSDYTKGLEMYNRNNVPDVSQTVSGF